MMVYFGFYNFTELVKLTNVLLDGLDQRTAALGQGESMLGIPQLGVSRFFL